jgi:hypothetical protein
MQLPAHAAAGQLPPVPFETNDGTSFQFVNANQEGDQAELACQKLCGHLASYSSLTQQSDVEQYYESQVGGGAY